MANLYQLEQNFLNLIEVMDNTEDEDLKKVIEDSLNTLKLETTQKVENILKFIKNLEGNLVAYDTEIKRLQSAKKSDTNKIESLKSYLLNYMQVKNTPKLTTSLFKVSLRNSESVNITDIESLPVEFLVLNPTVDKKAIKKALKDGELIEGAELKKSTSLTIK